MTPPFDLPDPLDEIRAQRELVRRATSGKRENDHVHDWQPRDDLSVATPGGGAWKLRTYECADCGKLESRRF